MKKIFTLICIILIVVLLSSCSSKSNSVSKSVEKSKKEVVIQKKTNKPVLSYNEALNVVNKFYKNISNGNDVKITSDFKDTFEIDGSGYYYFDVYISMQPAQSIMVDSTNGKIYERLEDWFDKTTPEDDRHVIKWRTPQHKTKKFPLYETSGILHIKKDGSVTGVLLSVRELDRKGNGARAAQASITGKFDGKNGLCTFDDDHWGNSGKLRLTLEGDKLIGQIKITNRAYSNWEIIEEERLIFNKKK